MNRSAFIKKTLLSFTALFIPIKNKTAEKKKYFLTKFYVAGFIYYDGGTALRNLKPNDELLIKAEPGNPYDRRALEIYTANNLKLGYVPREENPIPSRLMRQNLNLTGVVDKINLQADTWKKLRVSLFVET